MIKKFNVEKTKQLNKINAILSIIYHKPKAGACTELSDVKNVLIIEFALIGDMIMDIPFLKTIKHNCPDSHITLVGMSWAEIVLGDQDLVDEFIIFDGKNKLSSPKQVLYNFREIRKVLKKINQKTYELGFEPKGDLRHTLFLRYTKCNRTISYNYTGGSYLVTDSFTPKRETTHLVDEKLDLLELSGFKVQEEDRIPDLKLSVESQDIVEKFYILNDLSNKKIIGIHPGASNVNKQYRSYPELIKEIIKYGKNNTVFAVFEGPGEAAIVDNVVKQLEEVGADYIRVKRKIKEYIALVSICDYMICNDSAAGHIAAAYGIPCVILFGPVKPETALPRSVATIKYVSHDLQCKPCTLPVCPLGTEQCIKGIDVNSIINLIKGDLEKL